MDTATKRYAVTEMVCNSLEIIGNLVDERIRVKQAAKKEKRSCGKTTTLQMGYCIGGTAELTGLGLGFPGSGRPWSTVPSMHVSPPCGPWLAPRRLEHAGQLV